MVLNQLHISKYFMFPWIEIVFFLFFLDNGPHYHNTGFILYLAEVNEVFNLTLVEYNNFEAGEGKSQLDTHFAHISHKIVRWVRVGNNLETGNQLGELIGVCLPLYNYTLHLLQSALSSRTPNYDGQSGKVLTVSVVERDDCIAS